MVKEAIAPADLINAYQAARLAKGYSSAKLNESRRRAARFISNVEKGASRWGQSMDKLDDGLVALKGAGNEFKSLGSQGREFLEHVDPKGLSRDAKRALRSYRNLAVVGGGAIAAGVALKHYQEELRKKPGGEQTLNLTKEASKKAVLKTVLKGLGEAARMAKPYASVAAVPLIVGGASALGATMVDKSLAKYERKSNKLWNKFTERFPEYKGNNLAKEHFDVMADFNPASARHPVVVKPFLDAHTYAGGDQLVGINVVQNLAKIEADRSRYDSVRGKQIADIIRTPLLEMAKGVTNTSDAIIQGQMMQVDRNARAEEQMKQRTKSPMEREALLTRAGKDYADYLRSVGVDNPSKAEVDAYIQNMREMTSVPINDGSFRALVEQVAEMRLRAQQAQQAQQGTT